LRIPIIFELNRVKNKTIAIDKFAIVLPKKVVFLNLA